MKQSLSKTLAISFIATAAIFVGCVDSEKDFYDSSFRAKNPMGDILAPDGSDWQLSTAVKLTVNAADEYSGKYYYVIEVFDANPAISADANLLDKGVAKEGQAFTTEISVSKAIPTLYIRQTTPTGLAAIRAYETASGTIDCNFGTSITPTAKSRAMTRGFVDMKAPDVNDENIFPKSAPKDIEQFKGWGFKPNKSYEVKSDIKQINLGGTTNIKLYVTENINLNEQVYLTKGSTLYILPGVTVTMPQATNNGQENSMISIGEGATFKTSGNIQLDSNFKFYNLGTVSANNLSCTNNSIFYNGGTATLVNSLSGQNAGGTILNDGDVTAANVTIAGESHMVNTKTVNAKMTTLNCTNGSWENSGEWITDNMKISAWNNFSINKCKLIVNQLLDLHEAKLINDADSYIRCNNLYMDNTLIELGSKSLFVVTEQAKYKYHRNNTFGFRGTGTNMALLKVKKAVAELPNNNDMIHYSGNLQVACADHPEKDIDKTNKRWTITESVEWTAEPTIEIKQTKCNEGSAITPTPPTNPDFPIIVEPKEKHSLLFEDQWPLYGDYDMNDIVIDLKGFKYALDEKNRTNEFSFTVTLQAVGAEKAIAAAVMLDKISASKVKSITYEDKKDKWAQPTSFNVTGSGVETDQQNAVIPLFDEAHSLMGKMDRSFINTLSGSNNNVSPSQYPEVTIIIELNEKVNKSDFNINNMNFFIITDKAPKRREIHMPGYKPSQLANIDLFGGNDDGSSLSGNKYYVSKENLSWGFIVPQEFKWALEYINIKDAYSDFEGWITSGGKENTKWYHSFDNTQTFQNNKN